GAGERLFRSVAVATTTLGALECGGEGPGGLLPARAGWPGEQPGMCHPGAPAPGNEVGGPGDGTPQLSGRDLLTDEVVEDRHAHPRLSRWNFRPQHRSGRRRFRPNPSWRPRWVRGRETGHRSISALKTGPGATAIRSSVALTRPSRRYLVRRTHRSTDHEFPPAPGPAFGTVAPASPVPPAASRARTAASGATARGSAIRPAAGGTSERRSATTSVRTRATPVRSRTATALRATAAVRAAPANTGHVHRRQDRLRDRRGHHRPRHRHRPDAPPGRRWGRDRRPRSLGDGRGH